MILFVILKTVSLTIDLKKSVQLEDKSFVDFRSLFCLYYKILSKHIYKLYDYRLLIMLVRNLNVVENIAIEKREM